MNYATYDLFRKRSNNRMSACRVYGKDEGFFSLTLADIAVSPSVVRIGSRRTMVVHPLLEAHDT